MPKQNVIVLSDKAVAFMNTPAPLPVVEDIYSISDKRAWVVVSTEIQGEKKAARKLEEAKVSTFLPIERALVRNTMMRDTVVAGVLLRRRKKTVSKHVERPLMTGYLFAEVPLIERDDGRPAICAHGAATISGVDGVRRILGSPDGPIAIPAKFVEWIRKQQASGAFDQTDKKPDWAKKGQKVRVTDGPFASFWGVIEECLSPQMLKVAVEIFGRSTPVTLELAQVQKPC